MPVPSSKDAPKSSPNSRLDNLFDEEVIDLDETFSSVEDNPPSQEQLKALRKRAEDILEQKRLEQELSDYDHWDEDWDD